jgi:hypothetical protein
MPFPQIDRKVYNQIKAKMYRTNKECAGLLYRDKLENEEIISLDEKNNYIQTYISGVEIFDSEQILADDLGFIIDSDVFKENVDIIKSNDKIICGLFHSHPRQAFMSDVDETNLKLITPIFCDDNRYIHQHIKDYKFNGNSQDIVIPIDRKIKGALNVSSITTIENIAKHRKSKQSPVITIDFEEIGWFYSLVMPGFPYAWPKDAFVRVDAVFYDRESFESFIPFESHGLKLHKPRNKKKWGYRI